MERGQVVHLWRFAVKGLDRDSLPAVKLEAGLGLPNDRRWALNFCDDSSDVEHPATGKKSEQREPPLQFDPQRPCWLHKQNFLCAFTGNDVLSSLETSYDDATNTLVVLERDGGKQLLEAKLTRSADRSQAENFFSQLSGRRVRMVQSEAGPHHFGNTPRGFRSKRRPGGHPSGSILHIVNVQTVRQLSKRAGCDPPLRASRFRPNLVIDGFDAWQEFAWVGKRVHIGTVELEILSRTIRCDATKIDGRNGTGATDFDVPSLLQQHFPEHGPYLGVYARVVRGGQMEVGSQVRVAPESPIGPAATIIASATLLVAAFAILAALAALMAPELWASFLDGMARSLSVRPG